MGTVQAGDQSVFACLQPAPNPVTTEAAHIKYSDELKYDPGRIQVHTGLYGQKLLPRQVPYGRENPCKADASTVRDTPTTTARRCQIAVVAPGLLARGALTVVYDRR